MIAFWGRSLSLAIALWLISGCTIEPSAGGGVVVKPADSSESSPETEASSEPPSITNFFMGSKPADASTTESGACTVDLPEGGIEVTKGTHYNFNPNRPIGELLERADIFSEPSWDGRDLGYGVEGDKVLMPLWTVDDDCALWYQVVFRESGTEGWTPASNVNLPGWAVHY